MEDNQVITNGDPLKDLYNEFNPKLNLAKSYDEFKATMQDSSNRKAFFDEFNPKLNLANDYNQFENVLGLKKKAGGVASSLTESQFPSQKSNLPDFEKGQKIAERGFLMPEATPEQKTEGSYLNAGQNLRQKAVEKAAEIDAASLEFLRNLSGKIPIIGKKPEKIYENGELTEYGKNIPYSDFLGKAIKGINDVKFQEQELQQTTGKLPETIGGEVVGGITSLAPDLALAAMTGGKNLFSGTGNLAAIGNAITGAFVREQAIAGAAKGYGESEKKGAGAGETLATTLKESGKSAGVGALYELAGLGGSRLGNVLSKGLENVTAKEAVNLGARLATFSLGVPTVESAISEGKLPEYKDILKNLGIAGAMEAFHLAPAIVKKINNLRTGSAVNNFMNAPADVIDDLVQSKQDAQNLNLTAMDAVKRAEGMEDGAEKSQLLKTASNLTQAADIKHVTDVIANSSDGLAHIANDLPEDVRDAFMQKAQDIHQSLNPTELQKQGHAANISQAEEIAKQVEPLAKPENPNVLERIQAERKLNEAKGVIDENTKNLNKVLDEQEKRNQQIQEAKLAEEGSKKYVVDGKEVSQEEFEAMQGKPIGTKKIITQEVKPTEKTKASLLPSPLQDIEGLKGEQPNMRTEASRKIVNAVRYLEGLEPYTGPLDKLTDVLKETDEYHLFTIGSKLNNLEKAVEAVKNLPSYKGFMSAKAAESKPIVIKEEVKPTEEEITVYHGGSVKDLSKTEGGLFVSADKTQAEAYAKGNSGDVQEFKINKNDISNESEVRNVIVELGLKSKQEGWDLSKELMLHEILDPRFETSLSKDDLNKLYTELEKRGYKAIEMGATDITGKKNAINDILVLNPKQTLKIEVKPTEVKAEEVKAPEIEKSDRIPATYKTINIDKEIAKNNEIIKNGTPLDKSFAKMANNDLLKAKSLGKTEYERTEKPPEGYSLVRINNKEFYRKIKTKENAIQEPSTGEVLQRPQEGVGETGGERPRVEPSIQGVEITKEGEQAKINEAEELTPYQKALKEKQEAEKKQTRQFAGEKAGATRKIIDESNKIEANDARSAALKYLTGAKLSWDAIDEIAGNVKRATLNTGARELKSREARARDYVAKKGEGQSLDEAAHSIWDNLSEEMQGKMDTQDIKDALMNAVSEHTSKAEAAKALIEGYKEESVEELERKHYEKYGDNAEKEADSQFNDAPQEDLDIDKELINANYETEQQFQDAYWDAHQATYNAPKETPNIEAEKPTITKEEKPVEKVNEFLYTGTEEQRQKGLLKNLMTSGIPEDYKKGLEEKGLTYKVSNQVEASESAKAIINSLGITDALEIARSEKIDPSVGSAIYAESLNNLWSNERRLKADGKIEEANALGKQWSDITMEYANKLNSKGKWTAQTAYFYKTSPLGFAIRIENERVEQFQTWYENKEKDYKKVFTEILKSEEGQALLKEEVEKISKEERSKARADKRKKIDDFFEKAKLKGNNLYAIPIPPKIINGALEVMKKAVLAGESVANAVSMAVEHISKEVKDWDKDKFRKEYEEKLKGIVSDKKEKTYDDLLKQRIKNLEEQIKEYEQKIEKGGIESEKRIGKFDNVEEVKKLIEERDKLRKENEKLTRKPSSTKEETILKRIEKLEKELNRVQERRKKEKPEKGTIKEKQITEEEKSLKEAIYAENEKWDSEIDASRNAANDYRKLETERNRQLKRVGELKDKLNILEGGSLPESKKRELKLDTPEIESLKEQVKESEKNVRESISHENKLRKLEKELDRLKNRKKKEKRLDDKIEISDEESDIRRKIEEERLYWKIEDNVVKLKEELQRVKDRKEKITEPRGKRKLTEQEERLSQDIKNEKEKWSKELEPKRKAEKEIETKRNRIAELNRRIYENDFTAETYKAKKEKDVLDIELEKVKEKYNELKEKSPEYIDKKAKQYLDKLRTKLKGIDEAKKEEIIRKSIKEIVKSGGLEYEDFKDIVSETIGIKKLTDEQKSQIESLTEQSNIADDLEQKFLDNPTRESIDAFRKAKANSLEADRKLFEMTSQKADIVGTLKSLITLNYLGASTLVKNYAQNVIYQATVRFPTSLAKRGIDQSVYGATYMGNKMFGTKVIKPSISLTDAQRGYFNEYRDGVIRGWDQMIKGVDEKDYFATNQYASSLNPRKSFNDLKAAMKGELFLSKGQKIDKFIQATLGWQPYAISRGMIYGDKPPRYAAQGAEALQIARKELGITDPFETEAFMLSPEKYAYNHLTKKAGLSSEDANKEAKSISKRIVDAGSVATFQNENMFNNLLSKIDEWATVKKDDQWTSKVVKPPVALLKATTIPFLKTPANIYWAYFKLANPALTMTKSLVEVGLAQHALKKGDLIGYREFNKKSKESFGTAMIGLAITAAAASLAAKGLIRTSVQEEDKAREKAGEGFFGKSNELNLGALKGGDDYWVDLSWFGPIGTIMDVRGRMMEDNKQKELRGEKVDNGVMNEIVSTMGYSVSSTLNTLIFDQGAKMVDAIRKGWSGGLNQVAVNNANALGNVVLGATIPAINKALAPEKADLAADNVLDQIANNQKQRNVFVTWAKGYPPSKVSIWGEPISQDRTMSGVLGAMLGFEKGSADKFGAILYNEQRRTGKNEFFPPVEDKKIKVNGNDVKITVEEKRDLDTYIGQARKTMVSPFINDKSIYTKFLRKGEEVAYFTYSELTAGKNKAGQTISQEEADRVKLAALDIIYENGKKAGFSKFKEKYVQYQDATLNVEKLQKQALESAEKTIFKAKIEQPPQ